MYTYEQIANSFQLWNEYFNVTAAMSADEFDSLTIQQRIQMLTDAFGKEAV